MYSVMDLNMTASKQSNRTLTKSIRRHEKHTTQKSKNATYDMLWMKHTCLYLFRRPELNRPTRPRHRCCQVGLGPIAWPQVCSVLSPSSILGLATPWTYFLHLSLFSVILVDSSMHGESCPRLDVVHLGRAWSSSPAGASTPYKRWSKCTMKK